MLQSCGRPRRIWSAPTKPSKHKCAKLIRPLETLLGRMRSSLGNFKCKVRARAPPFGYAILGRALCTRENLSAPDGRGRPRSAARSATGEVDYEVTLNACNSLISSKDDIPYRGVADSGPLASWCEKARPFLDEASAPVHVAPGSPESCGVVRRGGRARSVWAGHR